MFITFDARQRMATKKPRFDPGFLSILRDPPAISRHARYPK
jgi:hypothetical protein